MPHVRRLAVLATLVAAACTGAKSSGAISFWELITSGLQFGQCTDDTSFRGPLAPLDISRGSYIVYRLAPDGLGAISQTCGALDPATCTDNDAGIRWAVAGDSLTYTETVSAPAGDAGCSIQQLETWTLVKRASTMDLNIAHAYSLADAPAACAQFEADLEASSPNHLGVVGCVVTYSLTGALR